jgi:DNA gyrase inhibitor GyrI
MSTGILYLRPIAVARIRGYGPHSDAACKAWRRMLDWLDERNCRAHAARGFGLVHETNGEMHRFEGATYDACVERFDGLEIDRACGIDTAYVPGGAYLRARFRGELDTVGEQLRAMRVDEIARRGLAFDETRPMIEVYLNDFKRTGDVPKIDLCVPVMI